MKILRIALLLLFSIALTLGVSEGICRLYGLRPYDTHVVKWEYRPGLPGRVDSIYGHALVPGYFTLIKNDTFVYHATHDAAGRRITADAPLPADYRDRLVILGCSFSYGDGIDDTMTHPYLLQQLFLENHIKLHVENWGVGGYCPSQFFIQATQLVRDTTVRYVVINYSSFEDERTICDRNWRKAHVKYAGQLKYQKLIYYPYFELDHGRLELHRRSMAYDFLPGQRELAVMELIDATYCRLEAARAPDISLRALQMTMDTLRAAGIHAILASITGDPESNAVIGHFHRLGYPTLLYGINTGEDRYNLSPADGHPNFAANQVFAQKLYTEITGLKNSRESQ